MLGQMPSDNRVLERLENYYDAAPRARSRAEEIGHFTLFVAESGWPYYARPRLGDATTATVDDVQTVLARQRELGVPRALEWVDQTTPGLVEVVRAAGADVEECPLLVLDGSPVGAAGGARMLEPDDEAEIAAVRAAVDVSFQHGGTEIGSVGLEARDAQAAAATRDANLAVLLERLTTGQVRMAGGYDEGEVVGGGSAIPVGEVSEIVGVGVLPAYRRRGLAGQLTYVLSRDALDAGGTTVFCSAQSDDVARVYQAVGFRRVGTACIASVEPH